MASTVNCTKAPTPRTRRCSQAKRAGAALGMGLCTPVSLTELWSRVRLRSLCTSVSSSGQQGMFWHGGVMGSFGWSP